MNSVVAYDRNYSLFEVHKWISNTVGLDKDTFFKYPRYFFKCLKYFFKYPTAATKCYRVILGVKHLSSVAKPPCFDSILVRALPLGPPIITGLLP